MYYTSYNDILVFSSWWKTKICIISIFLVKSPLWMSHFTLKIWRIIAENLQQILEIFSSVSELNRKFESSNKLSFYIRRKSTKWIKLSCRDSWWRHEKQCYVIFAASRRNDDVTNRGRRGRWISYLRCLTFGGFCEAACSLISPTTTT